MKSLIVLFSTILILSSCNKSDGCNSLNSLDGKWQMVSVRDIPSGQTSTKPAGVVGEVEISFATNSATLGVFSGYTPSNEIMPSDFSIAPPQQLVIRKLAMTKVNESDWGNYFVDHIRSSKNYSFQADGRLDIVTDRKVLSFIRKD